MEQATFGGGCFWCLDAVYRELQGVTRSTAGYSGGEKENPTYEEVCSGNTGHAEVVQVEFDPAIISYEQLLEVFWSLHDPTTLNRQGNDIGTQYRSAVFTHDAIQEASARDIMARMQALWEDPIVTEITPLEKFWPAEDYHQDYFANNPTTGYCAAVVAPKVQKFRTKWANLLKP